MNGNALGERYFTARDRLSDLTAAISQLAAETGAVDGPLDHAHDKPFTIVACGEVNTGKSTLINALAGWNLCPVAALPETQRVKRYRFGATARDHTLTRSVDECLRPHPLLERFHWIDTPGLNATTPEPAACIDDLAADADLTLVVFHANNPWSATTWDLLTRLHERAPGRGALVIQHADQRDPADIGVILGHVADLAMKRIGCVPPVFAISGRLACEAKSTRPPDARLLAASGLTALEEFISNHVCLSQARLEALKGWRGRAAAALRVIDDRIESQGDELRAKSRFVHEIEREVDAIRDSFIRRLTVHLIGVSEVFESECTWVTRLLRRRLGALVSMIRLFTGDRTSHEIEQVFIQRMAATVDTIAEKDGLAVSGECLAHWRQLGDRVRETLGIDPGPSEPVEQTLEAARTRFVEQLDAAAARRIGHLKVRHRLEQDLRRRNRSLRSFMIAALVLTTAGASCGALGLNLAAYPLCSLAALFIGLGTLAAWSSRRAIVQDFNQGLLDACGSFASALHGDYEEALLHVFREYRGSLNPLHDRLADVRSTIEPRQKRWQQLFLTLKALEQEW